VFPETSSMSHQVSTWRACVANGHDALSCRGGFGQPPQKRGRVVHSFHAYVRPIASTAGPCHTSNRNVAVRQMAGGVERAREIVRRSGSRQRETARSPRRRSGPRGVCMSPADSRKRAKVGGGRRRSAPARRHHRVTRSMPERLKPAARADSRGGPSGPNSSTVRASGLAARRVAATYSPPGHSPGPIRGVRNTAPYWRRHPPHASYRVSADKIIGRAAACATGKDGFSWRRHRSSPLREKAPCSATGKRMGRR